MCWRMGLWGVMEERKRREVREGVESGRGGGRGASDEERGRQVKIR